MDPQQQYEQRLRDEVIYLHSLWHQGPPTTRPGTSSVRHVLPPPIKPTTQFKKKKSKKPKTIKNPKITESSNSGSEWPTPPSPATTSGHCWPTITQPDPEKTLSPEEKLILVSRNAHQHALKTVHQFFNTNDDSISSSSSDDDNDNDNDDEMMMTEEDNDKDYGSFFLKMFNNEDNTLLKEFYEKNFVKGEFSCLVCGALGGKGTGKKFRGCLPLVQHSINISKTKKRKAHRAFGLAVCKILGWDIDQLSSLVSSLMSNQSQEVEEKQGNNVNNRDKESSSIIVIENVDSVEEGSNTNNKGDEVELVPESGLSSIGGTEILPNGDDKQDMNSFEGCLDTAKDVENVVSMVVHPHIVTVEEPVAPAAEGLTSNSLVCPDADNNLENLGLVHSNNLDEPSTVGLANKTSHDTDISLEDHGITHPHMMDEPMAEVLTCNPLMLHNTDGHMENLGIVHPNSIEEPAAEVPLDETNASATEVENVADG